MIFVTLGTQDKNFDRLLKAIDAEIEKGNIKEKVVVQAGITNYKSDNMEMFDLISKDDFESLMGECDLLITHGGVGSILTGLSHGKKVIAASRLAKYKEHVEVIPIDYKYSFGNQNDAKTHRNAVQEYLFVGY